MGERIKEIAKDVKSKMQSPKRKKGRSDLSIDLAPAMVRDNSHMALTTERVLRDRDFNIFGI